MANKQSNSLIIALVIIGAATIGYNTWYKNQLARDTAMPAEVEETTIANSNIGRQRPNFTLKDMIGVPRELNEWDGKIIVLNFWATWCRPCLQEIPMFIDIQEQVRTQNVQFIGIAVDDRMTVETFMERTGIEFNYPVLVGNDDAIPVAVDYGNETGILPYTVIIDADGIIQYYHFGSIERKDIEAELQRIANKMASLPRTVSNVA